MPFGANRSPKAALFFYCDTSRREEVRHLNVKTYRVVMVVVAIIGVIVAIARLWTGT